MTAVATKLHNAPACKVPADLRVIWSMCHISRVTAAHAMRVIDRAAEEGIHGIEIGGHDIHVDECVAYEAMPELAGSFDEGRRSENAQLIGRIVAHAKRHGLRVGIWDHELAGPKDLLDRIPALRAKDGLVDINAPELYRFVTEKYREFFRRLPDVDEIVLTMTETAMPVARRPFCDTPVPQRIVRLLQSILAATEPLGKQLVIRPFSAVRADELAVREAVTQIDSPLVSMMYKTEPFDWHPFLPDEPLIGSVPNREARAETDAGAEYYGQRTFAISYTRHIQRRLNAAMQRGATAAVIRVDRGAKSPSLDHPLNEVNVIATTRWLRNPATSLESHWQGWFAQRHGDCPAPMYDVFEQTFDVIRKTLYVDQQAISHNRFPDIDYSKHIQFLGLFEPEISLQHMAGNWSMLADRQTLTHRQLLEEKHQAITLATQLRQKFNAIAGGLRPDSKRELDDYFARLELLAQTTHQLCGMIVAHLSEMWNLPDPAVQDFELQAQTLLQMAERITQQYGESFFDNMTQRMRDFVETLRQERALETPRRRQLISEPDLMDYVLCGYASEGHQLCKGILHSGAVRKVGTVLARESGIGPEQRFGYTLKTASHVPLRLEVDFANDGALRPAMVSVEGQQLAVDLGNFSGTKTWLLDLTATDAASIQVTFWSTTAQPVQVAEIRLRQTTPKNQ